MFEENQFSSSRPENGVCMVQESGAGRYGGEVVEGRRARFRAPKSCKWIGMKGNTCIWKVR